MWINKAIPLVTGMDSSIGQSHHPAPVLSKLVNGMISKQGEIEKRPGSSALSTTIYDSLTVARRLNNLDGASLIATPRALIVDTNKSRGASEEPLYALTDSLLLKHTASGWRPADIIETSASQGFYVPSAVGCSMENYPVSRNVDDHDSACTAHDDTTVVTAWLEGGSLYYSAYELATGNTIVDGLLVGTVGTTSSFMVCGRAAAGGLGIFYVNTAGQLVYLNVTDPLVTVSTTLQTNAFATSVLGYNSTVMYVAPAANSGFVVAYRTTTALRTTVFHCSSAGAITDSTNYATIREINAVAIEYNSVASRYVLALALYKAGGYDVMTKTLSSTLVDQALDVTFLAGAGAAEVRRITLGFNAVVQGVYASACDCYVLWEDELDLVTSSSAFPIVYLAQRLTLSAAGSVAAFILAYRATLLTTVFKYKSILYVGLGHATELQGTMFIVAIGAWLTDATVKLTLAGRMAHGIAAGKASTSSANVDWNPVTRVTAVTLEASKFITGHRTATRYVENSGSGVGSVDVVDFYKSCSVVMDFDAPVSSVEIDDVTYYASGSILKQFNDNRVVETGFLVYPEMVDADIDISATAGALSAGSYSWRVYYESTRGGKTTRSYATTISKTVALNEAVDLNVPALRFTQRDANSVAIVVYRTEVNPTASSPFYRVTSLSPSGSAGAGWFVNSFASYDVVVLDDLSDAQLILEQDYLYAGEVGHVVPEISHVVAHGGRLVGASSTGIHPSLLFNKQTTVEWSDELSTEYSDPGGSIVGLHTLGNNLAIFRHDRISVIGGTGPDNTNNGSYTDPYEISNSVGAYSQSTICKVPGGLAFAGSSGFYRLIESLQVEFIGKPVYANYVADAGLVTCVIHNAKDNYVAYMANNGYVYVYFTNVGAWSVWKFSPALKSMALWEGRPVVYYTAYGTLGYMDTSSGWGEGFVTNSNLSLTVPFLFDVVTDYVPIVEGDDATHSRVRSVKFTGKYYSDCAVDVAVSYDGDNNDDGSLNGTYEDTGTYAIAATGVTTWPSDKARFEHFLARQKCGSIQVRLRQNDLLRGAAWTHIVLVVKSQGKTGKMSPRDTV